jgi:hypothetical protein
LDYKSDAYPDGDRNESTPPMSARKLLFETSLSWLLSLPDEHMVRPQPVGLGSAGPLKGRAECADNSLGEGPRFGARVSDGSNARTNACRRETSVRAHRRSHPTAYRHGKGFQIGYETEERRGGDRGRLMDMRRSGVVEAIAGDAGPLGLSAKLANSIERSNTLHKTYAPVDFEAVRSADAARLKGRQRMRAANKGGAKVSTEQPTRVSTGKGTAD